VPLVLLGDGLVAVGYYIVFLALRENRWAASIIEVWPGQSVISTGPYGIVPTECFRAVPSARYRFVERLDLEAKRARAIQTAAAR
jgi:hypothetical protein